MSSKTSLPRGTLLVLSLVTLTVLLVLSGRVYTPHFARRRTLTFGPCSRPSALLDEKGRPCRDLKEAMYDQRITVAKTNGARYYACVPPKNGSSYHKGLIFRILGDPKYDKIGNVHKNQAVKDKMKMENFTNEEIASFLTDASMPKYAIVRNPVLRFLSGYFNSIERQMDEKTEETFRKWVWKNYPVGWSSLGNEKRGNPHVRSQFEYCGFRFADVYRQYKVFRFEEPEIYVDYMYSIVPNRFLVDGWGAGRNMSFREFSLAPRDRTHDTEARFVQFVGSVELFDHLVGVLREDVEFFGYQKDVAELRKKVVEAYGE